MPEPEIVTRQGQPVTVIGTLDEKDALKLGTEEESRAFTEKGGEIYAKA